MTEPHAGADPTLFTTRAERDGDEWVINGEKWFSSNARFAEFLIVMAVTNPDVSAYQGMSMFIVPADTPGVNIIRNVGTGTEPEEEGIARLHPLRERARAGRPRARAARGRRSRSPRPASGGGRIHHAMRTIAIVQAGVRHDVRAGAGPPDPDRPAGVAADDPGAHRRHLDRDRAVPAARAAHGVADRQAQRLQAGAQGHLGDQGGDAEGPVRRRRSGRCTCTARSASPTRCRSRTGW